jgi:predicted peptidase
MGLSALLASGCSHVSFVPDRSHGFEPHVVSTARGPHRFFVYHPPGRERLSGKLPVILYLHGGGERGTDGIAATQVGIGPVVQGTLGYFPFIVVFPQCDPSSFWALPDMAERAMEALEIALREYNGDPERVYVTGNSMGGFGTYYLAARYPGRFAALAPICGGIKPPPWVRVPKENRLIDLDGDPYAQMAEKLGQTPTWIFHGKRDPLVPVSMSRKMAEALRSRGGIVRYTEWPSTGHAAEEPTYAQPELFEWFLKQRLGQPSADAGEGHPAVGTSG